MPCLVPRGLVYRHSPSPWCVTAADPTSVQGKMSLRRTRGPLPSPQWGLRALSPPGASQGARGAQLGAGKQDSPEQRQPRGQAAGHCQPHSSPLPTWPCSLWRPQDGTTESPGHRQRCPQPEGTQRGGLVWSRTCSRPWAHTRHPCNSWDGPEPLAQGLAATSWDHGV